MRIVTAKRSGVLRRFGLWLVLILVIIVLSALSPTFRTWFNFQNLLEQNSIIGIVACGMTVMMISGGFDLSVGAVGVSASVLGAVLAGSAGATVAILAGLALGLAIGAVNGVLIARVGINAFITTFAMASVVEGFLFVSTNAQSKSANVKVLSDIAGNRVWGLPIIFIVFLACLIGVWLLLTRTKYGHYIYSVGGNAEASHLSGVPVQRVVIFAFALGGFFAAGAGLLLLGQTDTGQPTAGSAWPLEAIAICVVGGVALTGGIGRIEDVLAATLLLGVINNGLNQLNVSPYWQPTVTGIVILVAVALDQYNRKRRSAPPTPPPSSAAAGERPETPGTAPSSSPSRQASTDDTTQRTVQGPMTTARNN